MMQTKLYQNIPSVGRNNDTVYKSNLHNQDFYRNKIGKHLQIEAKIGINI